MITITCLSLPTPPTTSHVLPPRVHFKAFSSIAKRNHRCIGFVVADALSLYLAINHIPQYANDSKGSNLEKKG